MKTENITIYGEIQYFPKTKNYVVWDKSFTERLKVTPDLYDAIETYLKHHIQF